MVSSRVLYTFFIGVLALERLGELALSRRNARRAFARGGLEVGKGHFRVMSALHTAFLFACVGEVWLLDRPFVPLVGWPALGIAVGAQALRYWAIGTLGDRWNVRIIFVPGLEPVTSGPYRWLRHPNYLAVILELAAVPLVHFAFLTSVVFTGLNAAVLVVRIRAEESALGAAYARAFERKRRFLPGAAP